MKKLFTTLCVAFLALTMWSCSYDDKELWDEIGNIKTELSRLNQEVGTLQTLVDALNKNKTITSVEQSQDGVIITFNDGKTTTIKNGKDGANGSNGTNAPEIGIDQFEGIYYWTIGGSGIWLTDSHGNKLPVTSKDGVSPKISVDAEGYWTLDGVRIKDADGNLVMASGKDGDSFFKSVADSENEVVFTLTDGTTITIPKTYAQFFSFEKPTDGRSYFVLDFGKRKTLILNTTDIVSADIMSAPVGWTTTLNLAKKSLIVQPPAAAAGLSYSGGIITLIAINKSGSTVFASVDVCASIDYTNLDGTFVVCEGNMTSVNGMVVYYDKAGKEYKLPFEQANGGVEIGNVVQDIYMANDKIYILTQNGGTFGGAGRFVVCDARTMRMEYADPLEIKTPTGKATWPQHLVITSATKGYVQYAEAGFEATSGICEIALSSGKVVVKPTVDGTFGKFTSEGAIKTRMVYSKGKLYVGCGHSVVIINPVTNTIEKRITYEGQQVKGIVKASDGNIWFALAGTFTGSQNSTQTYTSSAKIVCIDHAGVVKIEKEMPSSIKLPIATWSPAIGMCASFASPHIYFVDTNSFNSTSATRYNYTTNEFEVNYIAGSETIYGIMGVHPTTGKLWVGKSSYVDSNIYIYNVLGAQPVQEQVNRYSDQKGASPAGIDFAYRFTPEFINK